MNNSVDCLEEGIMITSVAGDDKLVGHVVGVNDVMGDECDVVN